MNQNIDESSALTNTPTSGVSTSAPMTHAIVAVLASRSYREDHFGNKTPAVLESEVCSSHKAHLSLQQTSFEDAFLSSFDPFKKHVPFQHVLDAVHACKEATRVI